MLSDSTHTLRAFGGSWLNKDSAAQQYLEGDARQHDWHEKVRLWPNEGIDPRLIEVISAQAKQWRAPKVTSQVIHKLSDPRAVTVVTGQQCGFLLGPSYTLYKALSAIEWAKRSEAITGRPTVPIFWLQSEDHDAKEIEGAHFLMEDRLTSVTLPMTGHERTSVAHRLILEDNDEAFETIERAWKPTAFGDELLDEARRAWAPGRSVMDAFAEVLYAWLGELGLVILNPRDPRLARLTAPTHESSIFHAEEIEAAISSRNQDLMTSGFKVQIPMRPTSTLSFFHPNGSSGPRYRVMHVHNGFSLSGSPETFSVQEMKTKLQESPELFSTSALLRPLLQETWLPTVATVVGPGEISYFAQLAPLFKRFNRRSPGVIPRARARLWTASWRRTFRKGEFSEDDLIDHRDEVLKRIGRAEESATIDQLRADGLESPLRAIDLFIAEAEQSDKGMVPNARRVRRTIEKSMKGLLDRQARSVAQRYDRHLERLDLVRAALAPKRGPQERTLSPLHFAALYGRERLIKTLREAISASCDETLLEVELW